MLGRPEDGSWETCAARWPVRACEVCLCLCVVCRTPNGPSAPPAARPTGWDRIALVRARARKRPRRAGARMVKLININKLDAPTVL